MDDLLGRYKFLDAIRFMKISEQANCTAMVKWMRNSEMRKCTREHSPLALPKGGVDVDVEQRGPTRAFAQRQQLLWRRATWQPTPLVLRSTRSTQFALVGPRGLGPIYTGVPVGVISPTSLVPKEKPLLPLMAFSGTK